MKQAQTFTCWFLDISLDSQKGKVAISHFYQKCEAHLNLRDMSEAKTFLTEVQFSF